MALQKQDAHLDWCQREVAVGRAAVLGRPPTGEPFKASALVALPLAEDDFNAWL